MRLQREAVDIIEVKGRRYGSPEGGAVYDISEKLASVLRNPFTWVVAVIFFICLRWVINFIVNLTPHDKYWLKKSTLSVGSVVLGICLLMHIWIVIPFILVGAGYEMVKMKAPADCVVRMKIGAILLNLILCGAQIAHVMRLDQSVNVAVFMWGACGVALLVYMILVRIYCKRYQNRINMEIPNVATDHVALPYEHPCQGQCENPEVILKKSPTPKYHHNGRAVCASATRSGRYYRGRQRKYSW